jgi:hypothetical protein
MDPSDPTSFNHRTERLATGHTYHFVDQVPEDYNPATTPTLLCVHGFPDLWSVLLDNSLYFCRDARAGMVGAMSSLRGSNSVAGES